VPLLTHASGASKRSAVRAPVYARKPQAAPSAWRFEPHGPGWAVGRLPARPDQDLHRSAPRL